MLLHAKWYSFDCNSSSRDLFIAEFDHLWRLMSAIITNTLNEIEIKQQNARDFSIEPTAKHTQNKPT